MTITTRAKVDAIRRAKGLPPLFTEPPAGRSAASVGVGQAQDGLGDSRPAPAARGGGLLPLPSTPAPSSAPSAPAASSTPATPTARVNDWTDVRDPRFDPPLPGWVQTFRSHQTEAVDRILAAFDSGFRIVMLQALTGAGKSLIADLVRRELDTTAAYVATTKQLQDQVVRDFPYARVLKGKANYPTLLGGDGWDAPNCGDCTKQGKDADCRWCYDPEACPYQLAKGRARGSELAVLNTSYWLLDANGSRRVFADRGLVIFDEADCLEGELMGRVEVRISRLRQKKLRIDQPKVTVAESWVEWADHAISRVKARLEELGPPNRIRDIRQMREAKSLRELAVNLDRLKIELPDGGWVFCGQAGDEIAFRPVTVSQYGQDWIWKRNERFLLMSATLISAEQMARDLGIEKGTWKLVDVPVAFPAENRPVHVCAVAEMSRKNEAAALPKMLKAVPNVVDLHPDERILVHTVSYKLASHIAEAIRKQAPDRPVITYTNAKERAGALDKYLATERAVLVASSMDRGVDLPGDACRVQIIAKIPFPNLGDRQVSARLYGTKDGGIWYAVQTIRTLIQMTGRAVRSEQDQARTYILDHAFSENLWRKNRQLMPRWWQEGLDWRFDVRRIL